MALIKCPHCGNTVSDTVVNCIYCGKSIAPIEEEVTQENFNEFTNLSMSERKKLEEEFQRSYPKQKNFEQREARIKLLNRISTICIFVGLAIAALAYFIIGEDNPEGMLFGLIFGLLVFFVSDVIDFVCPFLIRRNKKKSLVALKMFQQWLKDYKQINYKVTFNEADKKWKNYFDGINLAAEGYKR